MSLPESNKSAASCARRDSVMSGRSVGRLGAWLTGHRRRNYDPVWGSQILPMLLSPSSAIHLSGTVS